SRREMPIRRPRRSQGQGRHGCGFSKALAAGRWSRGRKAGNDMSNDAVLYEAADGVGLITLNRPDNRNSMTGELLDAFGQAVRKARSDGDLRCVVITGNGKCFSAGADFKAQVQRDGVTRKLQSHER